MINPADQTSLICELKQGRELANQLKNQLDPNTSMETCEALLRKIVSTYDNALSVLDLDCKTETEAETENHPFLANNNNGFLFQSSKDQQQNYKKR